MAVLRNFPFQFVLLWLMITWGVEVKGQMFLRFSQESEARNILHWDWDSGHNNPKYPYDTVMVENYHRYYRHGPHLDSYLLHTNDLMKAYVGPAPKDHPKADVNSNPRKLNGIIRAWAMFDRRSKNYCYIASIYNYGEVALFACPSDGVYRAYAVDLDITTNITIPQEMDVNGQGKSVMAWLSRDAIRPFNLLEGKDDHIKNEVQGATLAYKMRYILRNSVYMPAAGIPANPRKYAVSEPVVIQATQYCYYWYQSIEVIGRNGFIGAHLVYGDNIDNKESEIVVKIRVWIAEPAALGPWELAHTTSDTIVSDYSQVLTRRFAAIGLFPCLREAHGSLEVVEAAKYINDTNPENTFKKTPHWVFKLKIHTDRLISTLTSISFTVASRQSKGIHDCFVGSTRVYFLLRQFMFERIGRLKLNQINLPNSLILRDTSKVRFRLEEVYIHGVHFVANRMSALYQPSSRRTDLVVTTNPCNVQEFAFSAAGTLYIAHNLLRRGVNHINKVTLPFFPNDVQQINSNTSFDQKHLQVTDVSFSPTHVVFLMKEGYILLYPPDMKNRGIGVVKKTKKYRPAGFAKRRWCPRTAYRKLSAMMMPIYGEGREVIILQGYPTEKSKAMWIKPPSGSCLDEGVGFSQDENYYDKELNETDIHYDEYVIVRRTNLESGVLEQKNQPRVRPKRKLKNIYDEPSFILDASREFAEEGEDAHFPFEKMNPATRLLNKNLTDYNKAIVYVIKKNGELDEILTGNGLTIPEEKNTDMIALEFTAEEKQLLYAITFKSKEVKDALSDNALQTVIGTITMSTIPLRVRLETVNPSTSDETLESTTTFPGVIIVRLSAYQVPPVNSRDPDEAKNLRSFTAGKTEVPFVTQVLPLGTAIPSYVIHFGNVLMFSSIENRYARPLHFFSKRVADRKYKEEGNLPLVFDEASVNLDQLGTKTMFDVAVTDQGLISVLKRRDLIHLVQDDTDCFATVDGDVQTVTLGSVVTVEGLRETTPFFRNDNIFQQTTPDGEIIYGTYDFTPTRAFRDCSNSSRDNVPCVQQPSEPDLMKACTLDVAKYDSPCRDVAFLPFCSSTTSEPFACLRQNNACTDDRLSDSDDAFVHQLPGQSRLDPTKCTKSPVEGKVVGCLPQHMPREEIRLVNMLGVSYHSILQGHLDSIKILHPEEELPDPKPAPASETAEEKVEREEIEPLKRAAQSEPDLCPFSRLEVFHKDMDFAEVGFQIRATAAVSYIGVGLPSEADIIVEFEKTSGIVVEITTSVREYRQLTIVTKAVDIYFQMPDHMLEALSEEDPLNENWESELSYEDKQAREKFTEFSITFRPSLANTHCKTGEVFKTIQYNIGCNSFSRIRLMSEATVLVGQKEWSKEGLQSEWNEDGNTLTIPRRDLFHKQAKDNTSIECDPASSKSKCRIPYLNLFRGEIFYVHYRDQFLPKFEQMMTFNSRRVTGNVVLYDILGSKNFTTTTSKHEAGCKILGDNWYHVLLNETADMQNLGVTEHVDIYRYFHDCFSLEEPTRYQTKELSVTDPYFIFNRTNTNAILFKQHRNEIFVFRAVVLNTYYNRFSYCKRLDTFFLVRVVGMDPPRQGLLYYVYLLIFTGVFLFFVLWYLYFSRFVIWTVRMRSYYHNN